MRGIKSKARPQPSQMLSPEAETLGATVPARVLVVDDEGPNRRLLRDLLARDGHEPLLAASGQEALDIVKQESVDLLLLDLMMPRMDGIDVLHRLAESGKLASLPVVVVTALDERAVRRKSLAAGATDFLTKPVDRVELSCKVRALVELSRMRAGALQRAQASASQATLAQVERAVGGLPVAIYECVLNEDATFTGRWAVGDVNEIAGFTRDQFFQATDWLDHVHPEDRQPIRQRIGGALDGGPTQFNTRFRLNVHGEHRWRSSATSIDPATRCIRGVILDIDEHVALEEQLAQAQKMEAIGRLAGGIAHDFNNLLGSIMLFSTLARDGLPVGDPRDDIGEVLKAADRAAGLTRQLLAFSRQQPVNRQPVDVNDRIAEIRQLILGCLTEQIDLEIQTSQSPAVVSIDPIHFDQILMNLCVNARDAMPGGGTLSVAIETTHFKDEAVVQLVVADTGCGMDEVTKARIFEPFFTTKPRGKGTGMGLSTCFGIVQNVAGQLEVESELGVGTTFRVVFPACDASAVVKTTVDERQVGLANGELVLVVEDDAALRNVVARTLTNAGYKVRVATDGRHAMAVLDELGPDLKVVISDVVMPHNSGFEVAKHAAAVAPQATVLLTSGYMDGSLDGGPPSDVPLLWKPVAPADLLRAVASAVGGADSGMGQRPNLTSEPDSGASKVVPSPAPSPVSIAGHRDRLRVLVVDDNESLARAVTRVLEFEGFQTEVATSLAGARASVEDNLALHAVVCDLGLPDGSGTELLDWVFRNRPSLRERCIVMTGGVAEPEIQRFVDEYNVRVVAKPVHPQELLELIKSLPPALKVAPPPSSRAMLQVDVDTERSKPVISDRVLVIEDDAPTARATQRILRDAGCQVAIASSLAAARRELSQSRPDAIVSDIRLGDGSGIDFLAEIRGGPTEIPVVIVTGAASVETAAEAVRLRATDYLEKPYDPEQLIKAVRGAIDSSRVGALRAKLLASHFGGDELVADIPETKLRFDSAISNIYMVYQPIVRASDFSVFGYEALLRCDEPTLRSPLRLLAAAEVLGRTFDVGRTVRESVASTLRQRPDCTETIFVNLHPSELRADLLCGPEEPLRPIANRIVLEVTERAGLEKGPQLTRDVASLRDLGYRIAADDLGEGYAGLSSLVALRPDIAKLDMSLVSGVHKAPLKRDIVRAIVELARRASMQVIAEGIEYVEELIVLQDLGVDLLQGYLFARPGKPFPKPELTVETSLSQEAA